MNKKNLKYLLFKFIIILFTFISCKNDNTIIDVIETPEQSNSVKIAMSELKTHFNTDGSLNTNENLIGNIIFDFGFEFIYPNTLSYNNGSEVVVENFQNLISVTVSMTDNLFVNGIAFPFNVETFINGSIQIKTINNELEFTQLLEDRRIISNSDCVCTEVFDPVCVEIQNTNGLDFILEFPNICYAECEGFTQNDLVNCDHSNIANSDFDDCFDFVYPFSIIDTDGNTIVINNSTDFENVQYINYTFNFVYPFEVIIAETGETETITNINEIINLLITCISSNCWDNCPTTGTPVCAQFDHNGQTLVFAYQNACYAECDGFTQVDYINCTSTFDCFDNCPTNYDPVCVEVILPSGLTVVYIYRNSCYAECEGFTQANFINCN